jgi:hypothetical protein
MFPVLEACLSAIRRNVSSTSSGVKVNSEGRRRNMFSNERYPIKGLKRDILGSKSGV